MAWKEWRDQADPMPQPERKKALQKYPDPSVSNLYKLSPTNMEKGFGRMHFAKSRLAAQGILSAVMPEGMAQVAMVQVAMVRAVKEMDTAEIPVVQD